MSARPSAKALWLALLPALLLGRAAHADYFLHLDQKADLISRGQLNGEDGTRYDVWVVPGYVGPAHAARTGWGYARDDLAEYGQAATYKDAWHDGHEVFRFGTRDTLQDFAFKGSYHAWGDAFTAAGQRTQKRVFGWWFAYPWATIEATGVSVFRLGLGVPAGVVIAGVGAPLTPAVELAWPATKSVFNASITGTALPLVSASWNTVVAPPLALLGQQPSPERADGFWMKVVEPETGDPQFIAAKEALEQWRVTLAQDPALQDFSAQEKDLREHYNKLREATLKHLQDDYFAEQRVLDTQRQQTVQAQTAQHAAALDATLERQQLVKLVQRYGRPRVAQLLAGGGLSAEDANTVLSQLIGTTPGAIVVDPPAQRRDDDKTNPLKRSLQLDSKQY